MLEAIFGFVLGLLWIGVSLIGIFVAFVLLILIVASIEGAVVNRHIVEERRLHKDKEAKEIRACLKELVELTEETIKGNYVPDSFTTQPARRVLGRGKLD